MPTKPAFESCLFATRTRPADAASAPGWRLAAPLVYWSALIGRVVVPAGFDTDFASVPRLPLAFLFFGDRAHTAAVIHDYLCRVDYPACRISWKLAADVFLEAMKAEGVPMWQRWPMYSAVRFAGSLKSRPCTRTATDNAEAA